MGIYALTSFTHIVIELSFSKRSLGFSCFLLQDSLMEISRKYPSIVCKYFVTKPETGAGGTQPLCRSNSERKLASFFDLKWNSTELSPRGWGVLPYMGYMGMCGPEGYGFFSRFGHQLGIDFCTLVFNSVLF